MEFEPDIQASRRSSAVRMQVGVAEDQSGVCFHQPAHTRIEDVFVSPDFVRLPNRVCWPLLSAIDAGRIPDFPEQCVGKDGL